MKYLVLLSLAASALTRARAQPVAPNLQWWDLLHYDISITPDYTTQSIQGANEIRFRALTPGRQLEIALQEPMNITAIEWRGKNLSYTRKERNYTVSFPSTIAKDKIETIRVRFTGRPRVAHKPPWDGGWIWATDKLGRPWISAACEGGGASMWLPCKDVYYDEPDNGVRFSITVPDTLVAVANGRLQERTIPKNGMVTYRWVVTSPINNYNIVPSIGKYVTWHEDYAGLKGRLDRDYWVIDYNLAKALRQFRQVDTMLDCFEYWLGPYPFYEDSYKLIEAPMLGMEHQSGIAYGNNFENSYLGRDLSATGWGMKWDFVMVHESGHEWFGNSITAAWGGEAWIHEGFTKYLETIFTQYLFGKEAGNAYARGIWKRIKNDEPILGTGSSDQYNKGSAMLHMIRQIIGDSSLRGLLQEMNRTFYHQTIGTPQILQLFNHYTHRDFTLVFNQYLQTTQVPQFEYQFEGAGRFRYRWVQCIPGFDMPLLVSFHEGDQQWIQPLDRWQEMTCSGCDAQHFAVDSNFYIHTKAP